MFPAEKGEPLKYSDSPRKNWERLKAEIRANGYAVVDRPFDRDEVLFEGQSITLPFSNMSGTKVLLKKNGETWQFVAQGRGDDFYGEVGALCESMG
jgi:hypothetical protein